MVKFASEVQGGRRRFLYSGILPVQCRKALFRLGLIKNPSTITVDNNIMLLHPPKVDNVISSTLLQNKSWERLETELFKEILKPGMVVADLGANIGYYTLLAAQSVGSDGRVFAFEPAPDNFRLLQKNIRLNRYNSRVDLINKAVGESSGEIQLFLSPVNKGDHRTYASDIFQYDLGRQRVTVEMISLDDFFSAQARVPDVIKMDIQGYEQRALRGMQGTLARCMKLDLFTEVWPKGLSEAGSSTAKYVEGLVDSGFSLFLLDNAFKGLKSVTIADILKLAGNCGDDEYLDLVCRKR